MPYISYHCPQQFSHQFLKTDTAQRDSKKRILQCFCRWLICGKCFDMYKVLGLRSLRESIAFAMARPSASARIENRSGCHSVHYDMCMGSSAQESTRNFTILRFHHGTSVIELLDSTYREHKRFQAYLFCFVRVLLVVVALHV